MLIKHHVYQHTQIPEYGITGYETIDDTQNAAVGLAMILAPEESKQNELAKFTIIS
jgi:hypothetical protein